MVEAAVTGPTSGLRPAQVAAAHGLHKAGARPSMTAYLGQLWRYRHFISAFAHAHVAMSYKSTALGQLWQVVTPLVNAAIYYVIFGIVLNTSRSVDNFIAHLCIGVFLFGFTQQVATGGIKSIGDNLGLIRAMQFPRASLPIAASVTQILQAAATIAVMLGIVIVTKEPITWRWLLLIPVLVMLTVFNTGLAMMLARIGSKVRDLKQMMPFVLRTWLYASGVFYGVQEIIDRLPDWAATIFAANPMLIYIELTRNALLGSPIVGFTSLTTWLLAAGWAVVVGLAGYVCVWHGENEYGRG